MKLKVIAEDSEVGYFPIAIAGENFSWRFRQKFGYGPTHAAVSLVDGEATFAFNMDEWGEMGKITFEKIKDKRFVEEIEFNIKENAKRLNEFCERLEKLNVLALTNKQIVQLFKEYQEHNTELYTWGNFPVFSDFVVSYLSEAITEILKRKNPEKLGEYFSILTTPKEETFAKQEENDFLKLISLIKSEGGFDLKNRRINEAFIGHVNKYKWIPYGYSGPAWDAQYFIDRIVGFLNSEQDEKKILEDYYNERKELFVLQKRLEQELNFTSEELHLINVARLFVYIKPFRKDTLYFSYYHMEKLLEEVAKRLKITINQARYIEDKEMLAALEKGKINKNILNQRIKKSVIVFDGSTHFYHGKTADKIISEFEYEKADGIKELRGQTACPGFVKGRVKIVRKPSDMEKFNPGDILVSPATNPNIVPAMQKAWAIITDEGGVTCHAAIVSREWGTPCIIGTKIATKVLKDGDYVHVDANKGVIKIIKK